MKLRMLNDCATGGFQEPGKPGMVARRSTEKFVRFLKSTSYRALKTDVVKVPIRLLRC